MRITIVTDAWFPQVNGVVRALERTRALLVDGGHEVEVIGPDRFRSVPLPTYAEIRLALTSPGRVGELISGLAPDAVHVATEGPLGWCARAWLKRQAIPFTTSFHTMFPSYVKVRSGIPERWSWAVIRRFHAAARATMVSTPTLQGILESHGFERVVRWVRGVDTELFRPLAGVELEGPKPHLMYVGRVAPEKNIEAFLSLDVPGTKFVVGDGPARARLEARYPDVRFLGTWHEDDLVRRYSAADVFVFPSRTDTLGLVMLESLACGVPVAAYPVQGPVDVVAESGAGVLDENLADAVRACLEIDRARCRARALEFSWDRSVAQFEANLVRIPPTTFSDASTRRAA
jgi:glycosyltransferase involved in cell wall biosynthesis